MVLHERIISILGRLLPYVPQRYVVPPGRSLSEARRWNRTRGVSFKDEDLVLAVDEDLDENGVDVIDGPGTSREEVEEEEEEEEDLLEDLPPPADLIDVIGPAPASFSTSARLVDDIPEPAPRDPDLLMNMVTYREHPEPVAEKSSGHEFNGPYYPDAGPIDAVSANFGSLRRNGHLAEDAASRFTYGTYRRHQMSRFQMSDMPYGRSRPHRSSSQQYDSSYFDSDAPVDEFSFSGPGPRLRADPSRSDSDDAYSRRYRRLSDNQPNSISSYSSGYRDKPSPSAYRDKPSPSSYRDKPSPSAYRDKPSPSAYHHQRPDLEPQTLSFDEPREEDLYQNVGVRRSSRDGYGAANGKSIVHLSYQVKVLTS